MDNNISKVKPCFALLRVDRADRCFEMMDEHTCFGPLSNVLSRVAVGDQKNCSSLLQVSRISFSKL